jgi:hypothetical protein
VLALGTHEGLRILLAVPLFQGAVLFGAALLLQGAVLFATARAVCGPWLLATAVGWVLGFVIGFPLYFIGSIRSWGNSNWNWLDWAVVVAVTAGALGGCAGACQVLTLGQARRARGLASTRRWLAASRVWLAASVAGVWAALVLLSTGLEIQATLHVQYLPLLSQITGLDRRTLYGTLAWIASGLGYSLVTAPAIVWLLWDHLADQDPAGPAAA